MNANNMNNDFAGKKVLITGGTGGIGAGIVEHLIETFNMEIFLSTSASSHDVAKDLMHKYPQNIKGFICIDLMCENAAKIILHHAIKAFAGEAQSVVYDANEASVYTNDLQAQGSDQIKLQPQDIKITDHAHSPDILINCAGISKDNLFLRVSEQDWLMHMQINLNTAWYLSQICLQNMLRKKWGRVISISSVIGKTGNAGQVAYATSKAGLDGMTKSLSVEVATRGITVNSIQPGFIDTHMTAYLKGKQEIMDGILSKIPMQRLGDPRDVARAVEYLIKADYVTGTCMEVSGGMCRF